MPSQSVTKILEEISGTDIQSQSMELETVSEQQLEVVRQDEYLQEYGLYRTDIVGDGTPARNICRSGMHTSIVKSFKHKYFGYNWR